jgi:oxygen-independent coproporphyrinogen-3 oxidase
VADLELYLTACQEKPAGRFPAGPAVETILEIDRTSEMQETMMVGLRLTEEGVSQAVFLERFGEPMQAMFGREIEELIGHGLLEWTEGDRLRLTRRGRMLGNQAFMHFV